MPKVLNAEQIASWNRDGLLVVEADNYLTEEEKQAIFAGVDEVQSWEDTPGKWQRYYEPHKETGEPILQRVERLFPFHDQLRGMFGTGKFCDMVSDLFGEEAVLFKEKINFKLPGSAGFEPHQDHAAKWDRYGHTLHITCLVCIDPSTLENGCLEVVRGKHKEGLLGPMLEGVPEQVVEQLTWEPLVMKAGDVAFFDSYAPHRSGVNQTDSSRRVLYVTYNRLSEGDAYEAYYSDKMKEFPQDCERLEGKEYKYKI